MPKMESAGRVRQISLAQIKESGNVRTDYVDIGELAESIKTVGLIEPVAVKALGKNDDGVDEYELVAGYRRRRAFQYLCDKGENFTMIDAVVVQGDKLTIQLVENLQRSDLSPRDREAGIFQLAETGLSNQEIAARLSKGEPFVSRNLTAHRVREKLEKEAQAEEWIADIGALSTQALCEIQGVKKEFLTAIAHRLIADGGTVAAARRLMQEYNSSPAGRKTPSLVPAEPGDENVQDGIDPLAENTEDDTDEDGEENAAQGDEAFDPGDVGEPSSPPPPKSAQKKNTASPSVRRLDDPPPHKEVDLNDVQVIIKEYIDHIGKTEVGYSYQYKTDAAYEIWAHLLKGL